MKLKRLLALLMAFGLVAASCGSDDDSADSGSEETTEETSADEEEAEEEEEAMEEETGDPADVATDFGIEGNTIRVGLNADLSGPFAALVSEIVLAQEVYWEWVNDNGGIGGYMVEPVILDSGYATDKGIENYEEFAQESEEGVLMITENTGSPITAAIAEDAIDDDMLLIPLSWASLWPDDDGVGANVLEKQITYCAEAMNGVSWLKTKAEAEGLDPKLAIMSQPGEYGEDGAVGAELAAAALGIEVVYNGKDQIAGDDLTAIVSQLVDSGATMVWITTTPGRLSDIFGNAVSQGFEAVWSGNGPSFSYPVHLSSDLAADFDTYYWQSGYAVPWRGNDSAGMQEMVSVMTERRPDATVSDQYLTGWIEGIMAQTIIEQAIANGDLTRAGVVAASREVEIDMKGLSPNQSYGGTYDENIVRESYIYDVVAGDFDLQPLSAEAGGTGLVIEEGPFIADILADYEFGGACI
jgi:ABC-type branched-subunit amino acid transport system substrate-binding protein